MDAATEDTPLWLSHHHPEQYDRCVVLGGRHLCRRCIVLYPTAIVAGIILGITGPWPTDLDPWLLWLLPLPAVIESSSASVRRRTGASLSWAPAVPA